MGFKSLKSLSKRMIEQCWQTTITIILFNIVILALIIWIGKVMQYHQSIVVLGRISRVCHIHIETDIEQEAL